MNEKIIHHWQENQEQNNKLEANANSTKLDLDKFKSLVNSVLPDFYPYMVRRLNMAELTGALGRSQISANSILESVYQGLYQRFENKPEKLEKLKIWVYQIGELILEETLNEKIFEQNHLMGLSQLADLELSDLEATYTIDADGELVLLEELDDAIPLQKFDLQSILEDNSTADQIEQALSSEDRKILQLEINKALVMIPEIERTVFDLYWLGEMEIEQIAEIRNLTVDETKRILERVTLQVKERLEYRLKQGGL
ncbi:MAG: hypothetical protein DHS20C17_14500 [Cyclobacteriaceae bacterium]|nr:MAG: hypothetical protein DHS20C17_14500 [Cyclobacteriaceae bacterium]